MGSCSSSGSRPGRIVPGSETTVVVSHASQYHSPLPYDRLRRVSHTVREKTKLISRVRRIRGQVEALERALETEAGCAQTTQLIASIRGAVNSLLAEVVEGHIRVHVVDPERERNQDRADAGHDLIEVVRAYFK